MFVSFVLAACIAIDGESSTGKYNPVLDIGDAAPQWTELPGVDGLSHSFDQLADFDALVVIFTCNSCPYAVDYEDRIIELHERFSERNVGIVAINVNTTDEDKLEAMQQRAEEKGFEFPYLYDESQQIALDYGATYTPEFFVIDRDRKIAYMGAMDDSSDADEVEQTHVNDALEAVLSGTKPELEETIAIGCRIRMKRRR